MIRFAYRLETWAIVWTLLGVLLVGSATSTLLTGCATSGDPRDGFVQVNDAFIAAQQFLVQERLTGRLSDAEWEEVYRSLTLGDILLDEYDRLSAAGEPTESVAGQLRAILEAIQPFLVDGGFYDR